MTTDAVLPELAPDATLFVPAAGGHWLATELARGPWDPRALHGGAPAALFAHAVESVPDDGVDWHIARLTVELERPVPLEPLDVRAEVLRPGRKVSLVEATMSLAGNGATIARARALRIRQADVALPHDDAELAPLLAHEPPPPGPAEGRALGGLVTDYPGYHNAATEHRFVRGSWEQLGPVIDWIRLRVPVAPGVALTGLQRVAGAADFANGISRVLSFESHLFINPDLTIHLVRPAVGEWIALDCVTHHGARGAGLTDSALYDEAGRIGRANQSLLLDLR